MHTQEIQQLLLDLASIDKQQQSQAAVALAKPGRDEGVGILLKRLEEMDWQAANLYEVVAALGTLREKRAVDLLVPITSLAAHIADTAAWALIQIGEDRGIDVVFNRMRSTSPWIGWGSANMVAQLGDMIISRLISGLSDEDYLMRARAAYTLWQAEAEPARAGQALRVALNDPEPYVRKHAAIAIGRIGDTSAIEKLINLLEDADWEVRNNAADALLSLGKRDLTKIFQVFSENLKDESDHIRIETAKKLTWLTSWVSDQQWVEPLIQALKTDRHRAVRVYTAEALGNLGGDKIKRTLLEQRSDSDELVRQAINAALEKPETT